ncbi:MAG: HAD-IA family hydrolase [Gammaproteobacteria bacterium]|nr:HAD-IA family hydrolase [Gammaproteobacteria bacterium]
MNRNIDAVLFDLDGTLLDTADDLGGALNAMLERRNRSPLPMSLLRNYVSRGAMTLVCIGFGCAAGSPESRDLWRELLDQYANNLSANTVYFPGMERLLDYIERQQIPWGIVTNKPGFLTMPLLNELGITSRTKCIVSGDTLSEKKPHPAPLFHACQLLDCAPERSIYVGDDKRDIEAGNRAGMLTLGATYGYILEDDNPKNWEADGLISHPDEIHGWID